MIDWESLSICYDLSLGKYLEDTDLLGSAYSACKNKCYVDGAAPSFKSHGELNSCALGCKNEFLRYYSSVSVYYSKRKRNVRVDYGFYKEEDSSFRIRNELRNYRLFWLLSFQWVKTPDL